MASFAVLHCRRGLIEIVDGTIADALRSAADLTDAEVWLGEKIGTSDALVPVAAPSGPEYERFEVFVVPCVRYGSGYLMVSPLATRAKTSA